MPQSLAQIVCNPTMQGIFTPTGDLGPSPGGGSPGKVLRFRHVPVTCAGTTVEEWWGMGPLRAAGAALVLFACVPQAPVDVPNTPDASPSPPDAAPTTSQNLLITGTARDYFGDTPIDATLASDGLTPTLTASSDTLGMFSLSVPSGSTFFVNASKPAFRTTRSAPIAVLDMPLADQALYVASNAEVQNQYTGLGLAAAPNTAVVFVDLLRNNGTPLTGVPLAGITFVNQLDEPVPAVKGPYFFGANGSLVPEATLAVSTAFNGKARVGFLDCPAGAYNVKVAYQNQQGQPRTFTVPVACAVNGATLAKTGGTNDDNTPPPGNLTFTNDIYPILQRPAVNPAGRGCSAIGCHALGGLGPIRYDDTAALVHAAVIAAPGVINLATPANSQLLLRPLYELPPAEQNHPNATFLTPQDNDYRKILRWIQQGAPL